MSQLDSMDPQALPAQDEALRSEVRNFLIEALKDVPAHVRARSWSGYDPAFSRLLGERGWLGITLPREYGGGGRSAAGRDLHRRRHRACRRRPSGRRRSLVTAHAGPPGQRGVD